MLAKDVMTTSVVTVLPGTEVRDIAALFLERRISAVPVLDAQGRLRGIVSEGDLLNRPEAGTLHRKSWWLRLFAGSDDQAREYLRVHGRRAEDVMTEQVITVTEDTPLAKIASLLERHRIKRVPVMRDGKLVGIVSRANLLQGLALSQPQAPVMREDRDIREALLGALAEAGLPMHQVNVIVSDGVVQLWGGIESKAQHHAALAAAEAVASETERELGVAIADIGAGTIDLAMFNEGSPFRTSVLPVGGNFVTNDVAIGMKTSLPVAEELKIRHGTCDLRGLAEDEEISKLARQRFEAQGIRILTGAAVTALRKSDAAATATITPVLIQDPRVIFLPPFLIRGRVAVTVGQRLSGAPDVDFLGHRRERRQPAARASASVQNQRSPFAGSIRVRS